MGNTQKKRKSEIAKAAGVEREQQQEQQQQEQASSPTMNEEKRRSSVAERKQSTQAQQKVDSKVDEKPKNAETKPNDMTSDVEAKANEVAKDSGTKPSEAIPETSAKPSEVTSSVAKAEEANGAILKTATKPTETKDSASKPLPVGINSTQSTKGFNMTVEWDSDNELLKLKVTPPASFAANTDLKLRLVDAKASKNQIIEDNWEITKEYGNLREEYEKGKPFEVLWGIGRPPSDFDGQVVVALVLDKSLIAVSQKFDWPGREPRKELFPAPEVRFKAEWDPSAQGVKLDWTALKLNAKNYYYVHVYEANELDKANPLFTRYQMASQGSEMWIGTDGKFTEGGAYYIRLLEQTSANAYVNLATSLPFTVTKLQDQMSDLNICKLEMVGQPEIDVGDGFENLECTISWKFPDFIPDLSERDTISIQESTSSEFDKDDWSFLLGYASGKLQGKVKISVGGMVEASKSYVALYIQRSTSVTRILGKSAPFSFPQLPKQSDEANTKAKEASLRANQSSSIQHQLQAQIEKRVDLNPLLTIRPEPSIWEKLSTEQEDRRRKRRASMEEKAARQATALAAQVKVTIQKDIETPLNAQDLRQLVESDFVEQGGFIYAGAGVSMAAPASSPSWWVLMNELLKATFNGAPDDHAYFREKIGAGGDISRQPEEIMESFYFVLQDRLLTVFELLEAGEPNANHKAIALLAKAGKIKGVMTTNFDIFIERALKAEGVQFKAVVTQEEFQEYFESGCKDFAVLKIHGSVDRPSTIVAVANHYKNGKGFSGHKEKVLSHFLRHHPTLFLGYSGWDFGHANYQSFWAGEGEAGGRNVYWLNLVNSGGPNLRKIVGSHIGRRLIIGEGYMPDFALDLLENWDDKGAANTRKFNAGVDSNKVQQELVVKRKQFLDAWVAKIPKPDLLTLLQIEAGHLNARSQERMKRQKANNQETGNDAGNDQQAMVEFLTRLGADMAQGKITMEEYQEQTQLVTLQMTFKYVNAPKAKKDALIKLFMKESKTNPLLSGSDTSCQMYKSMFPSYLSNIIVVMPDDTAPEVLHQQVLDFITNKLEPLRKKDDPVSKALYSVYLYQHSYLMCDAAGKNELDVLFETFAKKAVKEGWNDTKIAQEANKEVLPRVMQLAFDTIDMEAILATEYAALMEMKDDQAFIKSAMNVALGAQRNAMYLLSKFQMEENYQKMVIIPLGSSPKRELDVSVLAEYEKIMHANRLPQLKTVLSRLEKLGADEVLATFELAEVELWLGSLKMMGLRFSDENTRDAKGFYPRYSLPNCVAEFLRPKLDRCFKVVKDSRVVQSVLAAMTVVGESSDDLELLKLAAEASLKLTNGKVLEVTPVGIPECYAYALQLRENYEEALEWYLKALEGIRTSVTREKTDAIVLQACLIQGTRDKERALKLAFTYSPHFSSAQQFTRAGPGRSLLVQQCAHWAKELGFASLEEAEIKLIQRV